MGTMRLCQRSGAEKEQGRGSDEVQITAEADAEASEIDGIIDCPCTSYSLGTFPRTISVVINVREARCCYGVRSARIVFIELKLAGQ